MPGTKSWCTNSTTAIARAISSRSSRAWMSICGARRRKALRCSLSLIAGCHNVTVEQHDPPAPKAAEQIGFGVATVGAVTPQRAIVHFGNQEALRGIRPRAERCDHQRKRFDEDGVPFAPCRSAPEYCRVRLAAAAGVEHEAARLRYPGHVRNGARPHEQ